MAAADQGKSDLVPDPLIEGILKFVLEIDGIEPLHSVQVAAAEENDDFTIIHIRFLDFLFGKEEECLGERCQDLLEGVVGLFVTGA